MYLCFLMQVFNQLIHPFLDFPCEDFDSGSVLIIIPDLSQGKDESCQISLLFTTPSCSFTRATMALSGNDNIIVISVVFSLVAAVAVVLRFYARSLKHMRLGADDYTILPALV